MSNSRTNYFKLGLFVFFIIIALFAIITVIGVGGFSQKPFYVETYFSNSVQGLTVGSDVLFLGVPVGKVEELSFVEDYYDTDKSYIYVKISMDKGFLVSKSRVKDVDISELRRNIDAKVGRGLSFKLVSQGITGLVAIEGSYQNNTNDIQYLDVDWHPIHPYIPSIPSFMTQITDSIEKIADMVQGEAVHELGKDMILMVSNVQYIISEQLTPAVSNIEILTAITTETMSNINDLVVEEVRNNIKPILVNVENSTAELPKLIDDVDRTFNNAEGMLNSADLLLSSNAGVIEDILKNISDITANLRVITENASSYSSGMLFGDPPPKTQTMLGELFEKKKKEE